MARSWNFFGFTIIRQLNRRRIWPFLLLVITGSITIIAWTAWPAALRPYVRIPTSAFKVPLTCTPAEITLHSSTRYATFKRAQVLVKNFDHTRIVAQYEPVSTAIRESGGLTVTLSVPEKTRREIYDALVNYSKSGNLAVYVEFSKLPAIDLDNLEIHYHPTLDSTTCEQDFLRGEKLLSRLSSAQPKLMHYYLIQDLISDLIVQANEIVGNVLLAILTLMFFWLITILVGAIRQVYFQTDSALRSLPPLSGSNADPAPDRTIDLINAGYRRTVRSLQFVRVIGPATGFLLTVSSLVAGLHPASAGTQDTFRFISSLQLALVATFMGLAVRIVAELCLRYLRFATERRLDLAESDEASS